MSSQYNNKALFAFITADGDRADDVVVLFKQQDPSDVADEFEKYMKDTGTTRWRRGGTNLFMSSGIKDQIAFASAIKEGEGPFNPNGDSTLNMQWRRWDTFIVTW